MAQGGPERSSAEAATGARAEDPCIIQLHHDINCTVVCKLVIEVVHII